MYLVSARRPVAWIACLVTVVGADAGAASAPGENAPELAVGPRQALDPEGELTLTRAVEAGLAGNPDLVASSFELKAADARIAQAHKRPNPELSVQLDNLSVGGEAHGTDALASTLSLSQVIEMGGKRGFRTEVAEGGRDLVAVERQAQQLDVLAEITRRFIALVAAQEHLTFAQGARELTQRTLEAITARVQAARSPEAERSRARIALTRSHLEEQQASSEVRSARAALAALWGSDAPRFSKAKADLFAVEPVESLDMLTKKIERNPDFVRFASEARLRDSEVRLAQAQARPDITLGFGIGRFNETRNTGLTFGFSMPLPVFDRNQGAIREAQVRRAQTDATRQAALLRARAVVYALYQELTVSRSRMATLRADALPQAQQALDQTQYGYERGRFSYLELSSAQQELLALRATLIEAAAEYHRVLADLERLTNEPVALASGAQELP